jgi:hypothetical protein
MNQIGDKITWEEARQVMLKGGRCKFHTWMAGNPYSQRYAAKEAYCADQGSYFILCWGGNLAKLQLYDPFLTEDWYITQLPPEPAPTAEELLEEIMVNMDNLLLACESRDCRMSSQFGCYSYQQAKRWFDKVRKRREEK